MKAATSALAVSVFAATMASLATTTTSAADGVFSNERGNPSNLTGKDYAISSSEEEKFAPRFDGLRFIETLVTAHR